MQQPVTTDNGERVIPASRRPDGTLRKERRIRAGYVPQEEQEVYQSVGAQFRQNVPTCPGMDESDVEAAKKLAVKSKAQKKNEKRKAKRQDEKGGEVDGISGSMSKVSVSAPAPAASRAAAPSPSQPQQQQAAAGEGEAGEAAAVEKAVRALAKKVRQCEALEERRAAGQALSNPEQEKLGKAAAWRKELAELEAQLKALS